MKKITFLFLLSTFLSFAQTQQIDIIDFVVKEPANQSFSAGTKFNFDFKIRGDYSYSSNGHHQIDIVVYKGNSTSSSNSLGRIYWNREDDYDIIYQNYHTKNMWVTSTKNYSTYPGQQFTMRVNYGNHEEIYHFTYPLPDLSIDLNGSVINSNCSGCDNIFSQIGSDRHYINNPTGIATIDVFVQNTGQGDSRSSSIGFYVSADQNFQSGSDTRIKTTNFSSIGSGSGKYVGTTLFTSDFNSFGGNFWLLIRVDDNQNNPESNENNNVFPLRFAVN
ncbi:CARDB domain-containing protein [Flagellimonas sp.]|uniref:CARDB domain-containing protein n=1 Tax=Flagellimonas sp. TaxID=2058762 RepID=UPI003BB2085C